MGGWVDAFVRTHVDVLAPLRTDSLLDSLLPIAAVCCLTARRM